MKIDLAQKLFIGKTPVHFAESEHASLAMACRIALNAKTENRMNVEDVVKIGNLAMRMADEGEQDLSPEEITEIRKRLPAAFPSPELVAVVYGLLDPPREAATA